MWTNTEELLVLESKDHPLEARGYFAKSDRKDDSCNGMSAVRVRDHDDPKRVYYSIRVEIEAGGHLLRTYGEGTDRQQSYYANQKNALKAIQDIFNDFGIPYTVIKDGNKIGVSWRKSLKDKYDLAGL